MKEYDPFEEFAKITREAQQSDLEVEKRVEQGLNAMANNFILSAFTQNKEQKEDIMCMLEAFNEVGISTSKILDGFMNYIKKKKNS